MTETNSNLEGWTKVEEPTTVGFQWTKTGEVLEGRLKNVAVDSTFNNKRYTLETTKGEITFYGSSVLNNRLQHVIVGDLVRIEFRGEAKSKQGRIFRDFVVYIKKPGSEEVVK